MEENIVKAKGFINKNGEKVQMIPAEHEHQISEITGLEDALGGKIGKVSSATQYNLAALNSSGGVYDSGISLYSVTKKISFKIKREAGNTAFKINGTRVSLGTNLGAYSSSELEYFVTKYTKEKAYPCLVTVSITGSSTSTTVPGTAVWEEVESGNATHQVTIYVGAFLKFTILGSTEYSDGILWGSTWTREEISDTLFGSSAPSSDSSSGSGTSEGGPTFDPSQYQQPGDFEEKP